MIVGATLVSNLRAQANKHQRFIDPNEDLFKLALMFVGGNIQKEKKGRFHEDKRL